MSSTILRYEGFNLDQIRQRDAQSAIPQPLGAVVVRHASREVWLGVVDWGDWLEVSSPYDRVKVWPHWAPRAPGGEDSVWQGDVANWLLELHEMLKQRQAIARAA